MKLVCLKLLIMKALGYLRIPLAFGYLTGKYRHGKRPKAGRITKFSRFTRYSNPQSDWATEQYALLAEKHGLSLTQLALAFY